MPRPWLCGLKAAASDSQTAAIPIAEYPGHCEAAAVRMEAAHGPVEAARGDFEDSPRGVEESWRDFEEWGRDFRESGLIPDLG